MKNRFYFFLFYTFLANSIFAQKSNVNLSDFSDFLEKKYDIQIAFDNELTHKTIQLISDWKSQNIDSLLALVFVQNNFEVKWNSKTQIMLRKKSKTSTFFHGQVLDAHTNEPLSFATIISNSTGVVSDKNGEFKIPFNGIITIECRYLGYQTQIIKTSDQNGIIQLIPKINLFNTILVSQKKPAILTAPTDIADYKLNLQELKELQVSPIGEDILRSIQILPGIRNTNDFSSQISIRGSDYDQTNIVFNHIPIYSPGHFYGIYSLFNPLIEVNANIYKNVFPAEFGGKTGGIVDILTQEPSKSSNSFSVDMLTGSGVINTPLGEKINITLGGRITHSNYSTLNYLNKITSANTTSQTIDKDSDIVRALSPIHPDFDFNDFNTGIYWRITPKSKVKFTHIQSRDFLNTKYDLSTTQEKEKEEITDNQNFKENSTWSTNGSSLDFEQKWAKNLCTQVSLFSSNYTKENLLDYKIDIKINDNQKSFSKAQNYFHSLSVQGLKIKNHHSLLKSTKANQFIYGLEVTKSDIQIQLENEAFTFLDSKQKSSDVALFVQYKTVIEKLDINLGLRQTRISNLNKWNTSPRLYLNYPLSESFYLKASAAYYNQNLRLFSSEDRFGRTEQFWVISSKKAKIPIQTSRKFMLGTNFIFKEIPFDIEFYHDFQNGTIERAFKQVHNDSPPKEADFQTFIGQSKHYGLDFMLKKSSERYLLLLTYSLSKSQVRFPRIFHGKWFLASSHSLHQLTWANQYKYGNWKYNLNYIFSSGHPYTNLNSLKSREENRENINPEDRISLLKNYNRIDLSVLYKFKFSKSSIDLSLNLFNMLNFQNINYVQYFHVAPRDNRIDIFGIEVQMLDFTPNIGIRYNFNDK